MCLKSVLFLVLAVDIQDSCEVFWYCNEPTTSQYGEYKYTESSFEVTGSDTNTYKFDFGDSNLMFGLSYSF